MARSAGSAGSAGSALFTWPKENGCFSEMGLSKVLILSFFGKLNLHEIRYFWGQEHQRKTKKLILWHKNEFYQV